MTISLPNKDLWLETALKDEKLVAEPKRFPDSPKKILNYFNAPFKIYSTFFSEESS